jgi:hypothetical protein
MENRFSLELRPCHLLDSGFFQETWPLPPPIAVIVSPCDQSCQPKIRVSRFLAGDKPFSFRLAGPVSAFQTASSWVSTRWRAAKKKPLDARRQDFSGVKNLSHQSTAAPSAAAVYVPPFHGRSLDTLARRVRRRA